MTSSSPDEEIERNLTTKNLTEALFSDIPDDDESGSAADDNHAENFTKSDGEDISSRKMETKSGSDLVFEIDDLLADSEKEDENDDNNDDKADQLDPVSSDDDFLSKPKDQ